MTLLTDATEADIMIMYQRGSTGRSGGGGGVIWKSLSQVLSQVVQGNIICDGDGCSIDTTIATIVKKMVALSLLDKWSAAR